MEIEAPFAILENQYTKKKAWYSNEQFNLTKRRIKYKITNTDGKTSIEWCTEIGVDQSAYHDAVYLGTTCIAEYVSH